MRGSHASEQSGAGYRPYIVTNPVKPRPVISFPRSGYVLLDLGKIHQEQYPSSGKITAANNLPQCAKRPPRSNRGHNNPAHHATIAPAELNIHMPYMERNQSGSISESPANFPNALRMPPIPSVEPIAERLLFDRRCQSGTEAGHPLINKCYVTSNHTHVGDLVGD